MILSAHQPDIFPYAGFFNKMKKSDYFDLAIYDQYSRGKHQDRVKMGLLTQLSWVNVPVQRKSCTPINEIILRERWKDDLWRSIKKQYRDFKYWKERKYIVENALDPSCKTLADIGELSIMAIVDFMEIRTEIKKLGDNLPKGTAGIIELCDRYAASLLVEGITYLSGIGGKKYLDEEEFNKSRHLLLYNEYQTEWLCSILTPIFKLENPKEIIK